MEGVCSDKVHVQDSHEFKLMLLLLIETEHPSLVAATNSYPEVLKQYFHSFARLSLRGEVQTGLSECECR